MTRFKNLSVCAALPDSDQAYLRHYVAVRCKTHSARQLHNSVEEKKLRNSPEDRIVN